MNSEVALCAIALAISFHVASFHEFLYRLKARAITPEEDIVRHAYKIASLISQRLNWVAGFTLLLMILLTCVDVILRVFGHGILGAYELISSLVAVMVGFSLAHTQVKRGHISIDLILLRLPKRTQEIIGTVNTLLTAGFYALLTWQLAKLGGKLWRVGQVYQLIDLPVFPFVYAVALGSVVVFVVFSIEFLQTFKKEE